MSNSIEPGVVSTIQEFARAELQKAARSAEPSVEALWARVGSDLRAMAGRSTFDLWFSKLEPLKLSRDILYLTGPRHVITWIDRRYEDLLARSLRCLGGRVVEIRLVEKGEASTQDDTGAREVGSFAGDTKTKQTFERFVIGPGNRIAHGAALAVAEAPGEAYNPLFIHGNPGLGKSHLLSAVADYIDRNSPELRVHSTTAESFTAEFIQAIQTSGIECFKDRYRRVDVLLIDDVQFLEGKARTADEFFHTFNALHLAGSQIVLSADRMPSELSTLADRLTERFEWGLVIDIDQPDLATRRAFVETFTTAEEIEMTEGAVEVLADYSLASIRAVEGALTRVVATASIHGGELTPELVKSVIGSRESSSTFDGSTATTVSEIKCVVAELFGLQEAELTSSDRSAPVSTARQVAMTLTRELTDMSLPAIATAFGRKDHTTVIHGIKRIEERASEEEGLLSIIESARAKLSGRTP